MRHTNDIPADLILTHRNNGDEQLSSNISIVHLSSTRFSMVPRMEGTGRLLQELPSAIRQCFRPRETPRVRRRQETAGVSTAPPPIHDNHKEARRGGPPSISLAMLGFTPEQVEYYERDRDRSSRSGLVNLPNEILLDITERLSIKDTKSLLLVNRNLAFRLLPTYQLHAMELQGFKRLSDFSELHWAAWSGHVSLVRQILDRGWDINSRTVKHNTTPLHHAARWGHEAVVQLLLDRGADINARDSFGGNTALHLARLEDLPIVVKLLLKRGANINIQDDKGRTALSYLSPEEVAEARCRARRRWWRRRCGIWMCPCCNLPQR